MHSTSELIFKLQHAEALSIVKAIILIVGGFLFARFASKTSKKILSRYVSSQQAMLAQKIIYFSIVILFVIAALQQLGFRLSVLLGSAGILTAAIAIASQTSISNIISGVFLIMEKSFQIGDRIKIGNTTGTIASIDLLSVKILTPQNTMIRISNESLIKSEITNITRFESRRLDMILKVSSEEDLSQVKAVLIEVATKNHLTLKTPLPTVSIQDIEGTEATLLLTAWADQKNYDNLRDSLYEDILPALQKNNISF